MFGTDLRVLWTKADIIRRQCAYPPATLPEGSARATALTTYNQCVANVNNNYQNALRDAAVLAAIAGLAMFLVFRR